MANGSLDVGTLSGRIELEDKFGPAVANITNKLDILNAKMDQSHSSATDVAEGMITAETAMKAAELAVDAVKFSLQALFDIAVEGSHAADIEATFDHITSSAGIAGDTLKSKMSVALRGTVDDLSLMQRENQNLAAGLNLSTDQMATLSKGAFALAKATGGDVKASLDLMSDAMVTGRTRAIALLTGKIDLVSVEEKFAASLGTTTDHLTAEGKQAAVQQEILNRVQKATAVVGDQQVRLADQLQQAETWWKNTTDAIGVAINESPVMLAAFQAIAGALQSAFGGSQKTLVTDATHVIENLAIGVVSLAGYVTDAVGIIGYNWYQALIVFDKVEAGWAAIAFVAENTFLVIEKGLNIVAFGAFDEQVKELGKNIDYWYDTMVSAQKAIDDNEKASNKWADTAKVVRDRIDEVKQKMVAAQDATKNETGALNDNAQAHTNAGTAANGHSAAEQKAAYTVAMTAEELKKYNEALTDMSFATGNWRVVLNSVSGDVVSAVKFYLDAGVALDKLTIAYGLNETQAKAIDKSWKEDNETIKETLKAVGELTKAWNDYYKELEGLTATDVAKTRSTALDKYQALVQSLQDAGDADVSHYNDAWKLYLLDVQKNKQALILKDQDSKASLDKQLADAKDLYQFKVQNSDQYTAEDIANQKKQVETLQALRDAWGQVGTSISKDTEMVRTLSGEVIKLKEYEARQLAGGSFTYDLTTHEGVEQYRQMNPGMEVQWSDDQLIAFAKGGGTLQQLLQMGIITMKPYHTFESGGVGEFGAGTLAMLHGHEAILPLDDPSTWDKLNNQQAQLWKAGKGDSREYAEIIKKMAAIAPPGYGFGGSGGLVAPKASTQVVISPGAFVLHYPILTNTRDLDKLGDVVGQSLLQQLEHLGTSL